MLKSVDKSIMNEGVQQDLPCEAIFCRVILTRYFVSCSAVEALARFPMEILADLMQSFPKKALPFWKNAIV